MIRYSTNQTHKECFGRRLHRSIFKWKKLLPYFLIVGRTLCRSYYALLIWLYSLYLYHFSHQLNFTVFLLCHIKTNFKTAIFISYWAPKPNFFWIFFFSLFLKVQSTSFIINFLDYSSSVCFFLWLMASQCLSLSASI